MVESGTATILFTDLVGSTELFSGLGQLGADELRRRHNTILREAVEGQGGRVVKHLGDGILATFGGAAEAVAAASAIQAGVERSNRRVAQAQRLLVRIGVSSGDVSWEDGDCHGTPVVTASRLCDAAEGGEDPRRRPGARSRAGSNDVPSKATLSCVPTSGPSCSAPGWSLASGTG